MSLSVVYAADTGHVLGALALTGGGAPADVTALAGTGLPLRVTAKLGGTALNLPVAGRRLGAASVDDEPGAFTDPLSFGVELTTAGQPKPALAQLAPWPVTDPVTLTTSSLSVTLPAPVTRDTPVLVLVSGDAEPSVTSGQLQAGQQQVGVQVRLRNGDEHGVLVLIAGLTGLLAAKVVADA
ncbi:hypothetical protein [Amycolatopsis sp. NPDC051102]|uniref:hypothetical protein n=1 Tax=Amycolatopsis sp. NPDC051102 TaxID=3155163 RepID=UPI0034419366